MSPKLHEMVQGWDDEHDTALSPIAPPEQRRPFGRLLDQFPTVSLLRYQPYHLDAVQNFMEKLANWLLSFPEQDRKSAFLLASAIVFVTERQFRRLQRRLLRNEILPRLLRAEAAVHGLSSSRSREALSRIPQILDATLFVANSDSSRFSEFMHENRDLLTRTGPQRNDGPPLDSLIQHVRAARSTADPTQRALALLAQKATCADPILRNRQRLVVLEDFSGSGSNLAETVELLSESRLPVEEFILAPVIDTEESARHLEKAMGSHRRPGVRFEAVSAFRLPDKARCFGHPHAALLAQTGVPAGGSAAELEALSERFYSRHEVALSAAKITRDRRHGFGGLALAFAHSWNCPDNTLPMIWSSADGSHTPLFQRASRHL